MSNSLLKKVTSAVALTAIVASTIGSVSSTYASTAEQDAANKLAGLGVIADQSSNVSAYRLGDTITRREMLKVMVNLAGVTVENKCEGKFTDLPSTDWGCKYAETALAKGFIAANAKFRPNDNVSKAEALKMVMKAKGIEKDASATSWESAYVNAAVTAGLISAAFTDYTSASKRGFTFTAAANATDSSSDLGLGDLLGGTGTTSTGTTTTDTTTVVKAGDVEVSLNPASAANGTQVPMSGIVKFAGVDFTAGSSDVALNTVEVKKAGLSTVSSSTKVWFEKNGLRVSGKASFTSEGNAVVSFAPSYVVKAGTTETLDLYVQLSDTTSGTDYQFVSGTIESSAANVSGSFMTPVLRTANYAVATYNATSASSAADYKASNDVVELGAFKIAATKPSSVTETRDELLKSITIYQSGSANLTNLANIVLVRNGTTVSTSSSVNGKALTFTVNDTIKDGATATYYVKANINNVENATDTYQFYLKNTSDINIVEASSSFRANADSATEASKFVAAAYTVNGGDVKFDRDSSVSLSSTVAPGTSGVVLMQGTITAKNAVTLEDPRLTISTLTAGNLSDYFNTLYLQIGSSVLSATATGTASSTIDFLGTVNVSGTATVKLYGTLKSTTSMADTTIKFADVKLDSFKGTNQYTGNQNTLTTAVGSIPGVSVSVSNTTLSVTRNDGLGDTTLAQGSKGVTVYGAQLSSTQGNPVNVTSASFTFTGSNASTSTGHLNNAYATLYVDGAAIVSKTVDTTSAIKFDGFSATVSSAKSVNLTVKVDFSDSFAGGSFAANLTSIAAVDSISSKDITPASFPTGATFTVAAGVGALTASDLTPKRQLLLAGAKDQKLVAYKVTASNDNVTLKDMAFTGANLNNVSNVRLTDSSMNVLGVASTLTATGIKFTNLDTAAGSKILKDQSVVFYVIADVNTNTDVNGVYVYTDKANSSLKGSNGGLLSVTGTDVASNASDIAQNTAKIAQVTPTNKDLATDALEFSITAAGKNSVTLSGATFNNTVSGYTGSMQVAIYKKSDNTLVTTGSAGVSGLVTFNSAITVDAGTTTTYVVKVVGATVDSTAQSTGWTVSLTSLVLGTSGLDLANYPSNTDTLPLTSSK